MVIQQSNRSALWVLPIVSRYIRQSTALRHDAFKKKHLSDDKQVNSSSSTDSEAFSDSQSQSLVRVQDCARTQFFLSGCCMAQRRSRRSLSGRSPFCQLKLSEKSQIHWKGFFHESNKFETTQRNKTTNHNAVSRRVQGRVGEACSSGG